jgi:hypothetical protein
MTTRTIEDRDGNPVEIEIEDRADLPREEMIQQGLIWLEIFTDVAKKWLTGGEPLPPYTPVKRKKKK